MVDPITLCLTALGSAAGRAGVSEGARVLRDLVGLQEEQVQLLRAIDRKVDLLVQRPFWAGRRQLRDALRAWRDTEDRVRLLREAHSLFNQALDPGAEPLWRSIVALHLAGVWLALDSPHDVRQSLEEAHLEALHAICAEELRGGGLRGYFDEAARQRAIQARSKPIEPYANGLALTRRAWGTPAARAPIFVGYCFSDSEEAILQLGLTMQAKHNQLNALSAQHGLADLPQRDSYAGRSGEPLYEKVKGEVLRGEVRSQLELSEWLKAQGVTPGA